MKKKILFCATVDYHFKAFHLPYMKWFKEQGWEVHVAASGEIELPFTDKKFNIPIKRVPLKLQNFHAYKQLKKLIDMNNYQIIHCHTPIGGVVGRLAARRARKLGTKVIYTAHGFHFYKGASLLNWVMYYPIERGLSYLTDCLITINEEDYSRAVSRRFSANRIEHVHGVGVDTDLFKPVTENTRHKRRKKYGYSSTDFLMIYAAEFNKNKNQQFLIRTLANIKSDIPNARLLLAGNGEHLEYCKNLAKKLNVSDMVDFLGYRSDLVEILPICDLAVASSLREGLPVNIMEAMASGLPVIAVSNRGHNELVENNESGWLVESEDLQSMSEKIINLAQNYFIKRRFGQFGMNQIKETYSLNKVLVEMQQIYTIYSEGQYLYKKLKKR
jgi:glycosyltransferase EpsD